MTSFFRGHVPNPAQDTIHTRNFETVNEFVRYAECATSNFSDPPSRDTGRDEFFRTSRFEEAVCLASSGWKDGADRIAGLRSGFEAFLSAAVDAKARSYGYDVSGHYVDVGRYLSGEPECFGVEAEYGDQIGTRVVGIRLNACVSGSVSAEDITRRGLTVLLAVDLLESCGIRCEVLVSQSTEYCGTVQEANVPVKHARDPVDIDRLAFTIAHPSYFRRFGFAYCESKGHHPSSCNVARMSDYGSRDGFIEVEEVCTAQGFSDDQIKQNVLHIAKACGLSFEDSQIEELLSHA